MSIPEIVSYDKDGHISSASWRIPLLRKLFLSLVIMLIALFSFGIGRLSVTESREPIKIEYDPELVQGETLYSSTSQVDNKTQTSSKGGVVASKNGSKYHYPHCSGAKQIKEENKIIFPNSAAAEASGYTLAANCSPR